MNTPTKFFVFNQNNSGGSFDHDADAGIGTYVWVEAVDRTHANARAEEIGLYFDGCSDGRDCNCCGDRWSALSRFDEGDAVPRVYGDEWREIAEGEAPTLDWGNPSYIHRLDGSFKAAVKVEVAA
jgi:hypothetical protein